MEQEPPLYNDTSNRECAMHKCYKQAFKMFDFLLPILILWEIISTSMSDLSKIQSQEKTIQTTLKGVISKKKLQNNPSVKFSKLINFHRNTSRSTRKFKGKKINQSHFTHKETEIQRVWFCRFIWISNIIKAFHFKFLVLSIIVFSKVWYINYW